MKMTLEEKIALLEEIMDVDEGTLTPETVLEDLEEWESLSMLGLMGEVRRLYQKKLTTEEIKQFVTVQDICDYLEAL